MGISEVLGSSRNLAGGQREWVVGGEEGKAEYE